jgi:hypothetical protein
MYQPCPSKTVPGGNGSSIVGGSCMVELSVRGGRAMFATIFKGKFAKWSDTVGALIPISLNKRKTRGLPSTPQNASRTHSPWCYTGQSSRSEGYLAIYKRNSYSNSYWDSPNRRKKQKKSKSASTSPAVPLEAPLPWSNYTLRVYPSASPAGRLLIPKQTNATYYVTSAFILRILMRKSG